MGSIHAISNGNYGGVWQTVNRLGPKQTTHMEDLHRTDLCEPTESSAVMLSIDKRVLEPCDMQHVIWIFIWYCGLFPHSHVGRG